MSRGPRPAAQLVITRPNGTLLIQGVLRVEDVWGHVLRLAPLVPPDATWWVAGPDEKL